VGYAVIIVMILSAASMAFVGYSLLRLQRDVHLWVTEAIDDAVRKQDDRIRQRVERASSTGREVASNEVEPPINRIGQPFNG